MKFKTEEKTIKEYIEFYNKGNLNLKPPYQRNPIWLKKQKQELIDTIYTGYPLPNIFIYKRKEKKYEMVDGQQRTQTLLGFFNNLLEDSSNKKFDEISEGKKKKFLDYKLLITTIENISEKDELKVSVQDFYYRVNTKGLVLNLPEVRKAKYFDSVFLKLIENLLELDELNKLNIFTKRAHERMNDADFVSELITLLKFGNTEKKIKVEETFMQDITEGEADTLRKDFLEIISHFTRFNEIEPINKTRYKQRNDFFTLFGFLVKHKNIDSKILDYFYRVLIWIQEDIYPSSECVSFFNYATNCVSQSNSKKARDNRLTFFEELFMNTTDKLNKIQKEIINYYVDYYDLNFDNMFIKIKEYLTININQ